MAKRKHKVNVNLREKMIDALMKRARIHLEHEYEDDMPYVGNCSAIDPATDREQEQWIRDQLRDGNSWAWCRVKVTATFRGIQGVDHLGGCSYESEESFKQPGGYYDDMVRTACSEIADKLIDAGEASKALLK